MSIVKPAAILLILCGIVSALLGYVNNITTEPIAKADKAATEESMNAVLADTEKWDDTTELPEPADGVITSYAKGYNADGSVKGYAIAVNTQGFSSGLKLMFGVDANSSDDNGTEAGTITGLSIVDNSNETPGLGANSSNPEFYEQFAGKTGDIAVAKDGGDIQAITGATITSRAIANAANNVEEFYEESLANGENVAAAPAEEKEGEQ